MLGEDLVLVRGQQERMQSGADTWANPVSYDKLAIRYRRWRNKVGNGGPVLREAQRMNAGELFEVEGEESAEGIYDFSDDESSPQAVDFSGQ